MKILPGQLQNQDWYKDSCEMILLKYYLLSTLGRKAFRLDDLPQAGLRELVKRKIALDMET